MNKTEILLFSFYCIFSHSYFLLGRQIEVNSSMCLTHTHAGKPINWVEPFLPLYFLITLPLIPVVSSGKHLFSYFEME